MEVIKRCCTIGFLAVVITICHGAMNGSEPLLTFKDGSNIVASYNATLQSTGELAKIMLATLNPLHHVSIRIKRKSCTLYDHLKISESAETTALIHKHVGPDELLVFVEGPTLQTLIANYKGCNLYSTHFEIAIAGMYRLKVVHFRGNYSAFNETNDNTPETLYDVLLDIPIHLDRALRTHIKPSETGMCNGHWVAKNPEQGLYNHSMYVYEDTGRKFLRGLPGLRSWVQLSRTAPIHDVSGQKHTCADDTNNFDWITAPGVGDNLNTGESRWEMMSGMAAGKVLVNKRIMFIGDSHSRTLMTQFIRWACGANFPAVKHLSTALTIPTTAERCGGLHAAYFVEYFCGVKAIPSPRNHDLVLVNCGHHPAAGDGRFPLKDYKDIVRTMVEGAITKGYNSSHFAWLESVPQPMRYDHWFRGYHDWRSYHRLNIYNLEANKIVQKSNYSVIHSFAVTMPFIDKLCDNAHYGVPEALLPQFQRIIHKLKIS